MAVPRIGLGTWKMELDDRSSVLEAIHCALEAGMTHLDTAEMYGSGAVESLVGQAIAGHPREDLYLVSKVLPHNASYAGTLSACEASLERLGTEYLDCYLLHWPGPHPLSETFAAFEQLEERGLIRAWGVSNFDVDEMQSALAAAGQGRIACNQVLYHLSERYIERALIPWCQRHEISVVAYSPFGSGFFRAHPVLSAIAEDHGATPRQVALAFLLRHEALLTIPKAGRADHVEENVAADRIALSPDEIDRLQAAFPLRARGGLPII